MNDPETYRLFLKLFKKVQMHAREAGKEALTDEEVEKYARSATEEHELMVAMNEAKRKDNSSQSVEGS